MRSFFLVSKKLLIYFNFRYSDTIYYPIKHYFATTLLVNVLIRGGGSAHSFDQLPIPPLLRASTTARPWPFAHVFRGRQSPLQPVMLCVPSHKCQHHCGTVINFGALGKMSSRCLFGLSFPTPFAHPCSPTCLGVVGREWHARSSSSSSSSCRHAVSAPPPPCFRRWEWLVSIVETQSATWPDNDLLFWPQLLFDPVAVCWVYAGGVWWEKAWPSTEELQQFTVSVAD